MRKTGRARKTKPASSSRKRTSGKSRGRGAASRKKPAAKKKPVRKSSAKRAPSRKPSPAKGTKRRAAAATRSRDGKKGSRRTKKRADPALLFGHTRDDLHGTRLIEELESRHGIDVSTIDIGIRDGKAKVRGIVSDADELQAVRDTIAEGGGISELEYLVQIGPDRRETDRDQARAIQDVIDGEPDLQVENIQIACLNKKVVLRGSVVDPMHKIKAGLLALRQDNVQRVRNRIVVVK